MVKAELLEILRCPVCVRKEGLTGNLTVYQDTWLICEDCQRKYPVVDDIPVMLIDEGDKWQNTETESLPVPPPDMR
ncbi:MAG: Trm112 family protein [Anaerolineae bacterium]|nr:Trm112 family protein [Anaerolineae bacterium]